MAEMMVDEVGELLQNSPPDVMHWKCELCGNTPLITIAHKDRYGLPVRFQVCRNCGLVVLNPRWSLELYNKFYTEYYRSLVTEYAAPKESQKSQKSPVGANNAGEYFQKLARAVQLEAILPAKPRILEIGGGVGDAASYMRDQYDADVVIVEPNKSEAEEAEKRGFVVIADVFENAHFEIADFDLVVMLRTVDHLIDAIAAFEKMRRLLKEKKGWVLLDGVDYFRRMWILKDAIKPLKIDHCYYFSPETLPAMMAKCALHPKVVDVATGQVVVLAQCGEEGVEPDMVGFGQYRFWEWERLANRPRMLPPEGVLTRYIRAETRWLWRRLRSKLRRQ